MCDIFGLNQRMPRHKMTEDKPKKMAAEAARSRVSIVGTIGRGGNAGGASPFVLEMGVLGAVLVPGMPGILAGVGVGVVGTSGRGRTTTVCAVSARRSFGGLGLR